MEDIFNWELSKESLKHVCAIIDYANSFLSPFEAAKGTLVFTDFLEKILYKLYNKTDFNLPDEC